MEKRLTVEVVSRAQFRGLEQVVREVRELRLQLDLLPVLGRFTLLVRTPEVSRRGEPGYNRFANDINGSPDLETVAPRVPRWRHEETLGYLKRIQGFYNELAGATSWIQVVPAPEPAAPAPAPPAGAAGSG